MICLNVILTVKSEADVDRVKGLLSEHGRLSRAEPGCLRFEVYHSQADRRIFIINEQWESPAAVDVHRQAEGFTRVYQPQVLPLVDRQPHPSDPVE